MSQLFAWGGQSTGVSALASFLPKKSQGWFPSEWDGWMASLTRWTWVWVNSGSWWWTGRPGVLRFMGLQRVRHNWATELNWTELKRQIIVNFLLYQYFLIGNLCFSFPLLRRERLVNLDLSRNQCSNILSFLKCDPDCQWILAIYHGLLSSYQNLEKAILGRLNISSYQVIDIFLLTHLQQI